jgi:hypothetical protein
MLQFYTQKFDEHEAFSEQVMFIAFMPEWLAKNRLAGLQLKSTPSRDRYVR